MKPSTFSDHTIPQSTGPHIPCVHSCDVYSTMNMTTPYLVYKHRFYQQWTSESSFSDAVDFASLPFQPTLRPSLQTTLPSTKARLIFRYLSSIFSYQIFFVCESLSFWYFFLLFLGTCLQTTLHLTKVRSSRSACN